MSNRTDIESVKLLCQSILRKLEGQKMISVFTESRANLLDHFASFLTKSYVRTQEDMENEVMSQIGEKTEELDDLRLSGGEAYRTVRQRWLSKYGEYEVDGLYFQKPIKYVAEAVIQFLLKADPIEEVYADDARLEKAIVATIGGFRRSNLR